MDLTPTPLSDPLYYLKNARLVILWVLNHHSDLLKPDEIETLELIQKLDTKSCALLIRMVMRKGVLFRTDQLNYKEIPDLNQALTTLSSSGLVDTNADINLAELCQLCRKNECYQFSSYQLDSGLVKSSDSKSRLVALLNKHCSDSLSQPLNTWWPEASFNVVAIDCMDLFDRIRLMFFGNLYQDLTEFVLTELGVQRYETVEFLAGTRAFSHRREIDCYLKLAELSEQLEKGEPAADLAQQLPKNLPSPWLARKLDKLLLQLAQQAEREQDVSLALKLYEQCQLDEAMIRGYRLREKSDQPEELFEEIRSRLQEAQNPLTAMLLERICKRSAKKGEIDYQSSDRVVIPTHHISLDLQSGLNVENVVINWLNQKSGNAYHVENSLFTGMFALLFWPALFAPVKGAFFNPFQSAPADLYHPEFMQQRQGLMDEGFNALDNGDYKEIIQHHWNTKLGTSCTLVNWKVLSEEIIEQAINCIPASDLKVIFQHMLSDLREHRKGLPDLIHFDPANKSYQLIEVKGPGDRLQDHQRIWIEFLLDTKIPVNVYQVRAD
ncbi:MAG: VRR-NUC domain-containing protein [bacterium]|nr:VRR-NUC domain-containing protein [bacterium]